MFNKNDAVLERLYTMMHVHAVILFPLEGYYRRKLYRTKYTAKYSL